MSLKSKLSKLRHDGHLTNDEYKELIEALNKTYEKEDALNVIKEDLLNCTTAMELGYTYKFYDDNLQQYLLEGVERLVKE